jgi:hypothetical protein
MIFLIIGLVSSNRTSFLYKKYAYKNPAAKQNIASQIGSSVVMFIDRSKLNNYKKIVTTQPIFFCSLPQITQIFTD